MKTDTPQTIYLKDYKPAPYDVEHIDLNFDLNEGETIVTSAVQYKKAAGGALILDGEDLELLSIEKDGSAFEDYKIENGKLTIEDPGDEFILTIKTKIHPETNTALEGLYKSGGNYCTQCEAEGFRRITWFQDRPDVLSTFTVRLEADKEKYPVLLSNGDLTEEGICPPHPASPEGSATLSPAGRGKSGESREGEGERHYTVFEDTTPKPCYLFALVAGNLEHVHDTFTTMSGQKVDLYIYVRKGDEGQCDHAMASLIKSMKWDEEVYGCEYQYKRFNIVAVSDFNMGAMENTSLNIFNTALVLAHPDTATDTDFIRVESVIAHEYFHNWTGNRITCRDWFQLSLKEGLTVFRDQEFSADMNSRAVQRIDDVSHLRQFQFPEDASPLAHAVRPDNYIEIDNFYTMTIYEKGAEVIRMFHTLLGPETYRKATDLYFERHDGQAVTCDDWAQCMAEASGLDLEQFKLWYRQAGTPEIEAKTSYDPENKKFTLTLSQSVPDTPGQQNKKPMHLPVAIGLLGDNGDDLPLHLSSRTPQAEGSHSTDGDFSASPRNDTIILNLTDKEQSFMFEDIGSRPVPSILRNFSAPVKLTSDLSDEDLAFLMVHDSDGFNRWEAGQNYALKIMCDMIKTGSKDPAEDFIKSYGDLIERTFEDSSDKALMARALSLPDFTMIAQAQSIIDPDSIHTAHDNVLRTIKRTYKDKLQKLYDGLKQDGEYQITPEAMGARALRNTCLGLLTATNGTGCTKLATSHYETATNMTDRMAALSRIVENKNADQQAILQDFYERFKDYQLVIDKWFGVQAAAVRDDIFDVLDSLKSHPDFTMKNPNRVRALYGAFAMRNPVKFHDVSGQGYDFLKNAVIELNKINPQIGARMLTPLREWKQYTPDRQEKMKAVLEEICALKGISPNVYEIASKSLNA